MPPVSGALTWTLGLESRAEHPMTQFQELCKALLPYLTQTGPRPTP